MLKNGEGQMKFSCSAMARRAAIVIVAAFAAAVPQLADAQNAPLAGTWNFVPDRSTFTPGPARYKSMTLTLSESSDMTLDGVDAQGKPVKLTYPAVTDGKPHPVTGIDAFDTVSWSRFSDTIATYSFLKRKSNVVLGSRSLSPDGNIITLNEKTFDTNGKQTGTAVMIFAKPGFELASVTAPRPAAPPAVVPTTTPDEDAGAAAMAKNDADGAIAAFTAAIDKKDKIASPVYDHIMRGLAYAKKGLNEQALADFDAAVTLKPDDKDARFRRGGTRVLLKQYDGAVEDLNVAIGEGSTNALAYSLRGFAYDTLGRYNDGNADQAKACELSMEFCKK
jgi:tetratricopeptide (TPR) repeat protein